MKNFLTILAIGLVAFTFLFFLRHEEEVMQAARLIFWWGLGLATLAILVVGVMFVRRQRDRMNRVRDGSYPLREYKLPGGAKLLVDPNKMVGPAGIFHPEHGWTELDPRAGWDIQALIAQAVQRTRTMGALAPGDDVLPRIKWPIGRIGGVPNAATGRLVAGAYDPKPPRIIGGNDDDIVDVEPLRPPDPLALLQSGSKTSWVIGQGQGGEQATFEPAIHAHAAIVGSTGTGKTTSAGFALAAQAIRSGYHLIILDPDGGADWRRFSEHAEWHETDREMFADQIREIYRVYQSRANGYAGRSTLVIIEEYGDLISQLRMTDRNAARHVDAMMDEILRRGRKRRMHVVIVDQYPDKWSPQIVAGTKFRAVFRLGPNQGAKVQEYKADQLPDRGVFLWRSARYAAPHVEPLLPAILRRLPTLGKHDHIIDGSYTVGDVVEPGQNGGVPGTVPTGVHEGVPGGVPLEVPPPPPPYEHPQEHLSPAARARANEEASRAFILANPDAGVNDLARHLAQVNRRPTEWRHYQSEASRWWHRFNPRGRDYKASNLLDGLDWHVSEKD